MTDNKITIYETTFEKPYPIENEYKNFLQQSYQEMRDSKNNISYWLPFVVNKGFNIPATKIFSVPLCVASAFMYDDPQNETVSEYLTQCIIPNMEKKYYFAKNGTFSDKFYFQECITNIDKLTWSFRNINYGAICLDAGGLTEFVLRDIIPYDEDKTACIYSGMPLRTEIRCFYDFDKQKLLGSVNYWDYNYVSKNLYSLTDKIVFDNAKSNLEINYEKWKPEIERLVISKMPNVDLTGQWSIDFLVTEWGEVWLIDMAVAQQSAYYQDMIKRNEGEEI